MAIQVPGYTIHELLGEGGMASVYLATQQSLDRLVALKVLKKFDTDAQVQRFFNEGKIIASLNQRTIITIHDLGEVNERCFLAMEYLEGGDLKQRIDAGMSPDEALELIKLIAHCLDFVHQKDIIHRDIKPENILFRKDGSPVLTDFGVAKHIQADSALTMDGSAIGSPHYLSPEQAEQKPLDARTDIYSLGIIFYEMLTGRKPFQGDSPIEIIIAHLTTEAAPLPEHLSHFQELVDSMIAKDADERFGSAADLVDFLNTFKQAAPKQRFSDSFNRMVSSEKSKDGLSGQKPSFSSGTLLNKAVGLGLAITISSAFAVYYHADSETVLDTPSPTKQLDVQVVADDEGLTSAEQDEVNALLNSAELILSGPELSLLDLEKVYAAYDEVLKLDADNNQALQGVTRIASLRVAVQQEIDFYLSEADKAIQDYRLTSPANHNALFYYRKVLIMDAENSEAQQGNIRIANAYADLVESYLKDFEYSKAKSTLSKGLSVDPTSPRLLALKEQTNAFKDAPKRVFGKIKSIFD